MDESMVIEALAAEISRATEAGDLERVGKAAELLGRVVERISREEAAGTTPGRPVTVPLPRREQLAGIARRISTEALAAELAAERGDCAMVHATYQRLAGLFAEYRLAYVQSLGPSH